MKEKWAILVPFEVGVVILLTSAIWYSASFMTYIMAIVLFIVVLPLIFGEHSMSAKEIKHVLILLATFIVILPLLVMLLTEYFSVVVLIPLCASFSLFSVAYFSILLNHAYQARLTL